MHPAYFVTLAFLFSSSAQIMSIESFNPQLTSYQLSSVIPSTSSLTYTVLDEDVENIDLILGHNGV